MKSSVFSLLSLTTHNSRTCSILLFGLLGLACSSGSPPAKTAAESRQSSPIVPRPRPASAPNTIDKPTAESVKDAPVSLQELLAYAEQNSPLLAVARSTRSRAEAAKTAASLVLTSNPELSIALGPRMGRDGTGIDVDVSLMQQIPIAGERGLRREAADRLRDLTDAEIEQMSWNVHCDVHAAFHRALVERERALLAKRLVAFQREVFVFVERQIAAGEAESLSLRLAHAEVAQAEQVAVLAEQAFFAARVRLAQFVGWPVSQPPLPIGEFEPPRDPPPLDELRSLAQQHLPNLKASLARVREAEARVSLADREAWMQPSVGVLYRREGNPSVEGPYDIVMGALSFSVPSFQLNQGERATARADTQVATAELDALHRLLEGRIVESRSEVVAAIARTRAYGAEILPRFEENLELLRRSFELGEIDILALSTGRERFLRIQSDALGAQQDYFFALAGLERVIGVDLSLDAPSEEISP